MEQQRWTDLTDPTSSPAANSAAVSRPGDPGQEASEPWAETAWAVVTATGIVQARCGQPTAEGTCIAWRLSSPAGRSWKRCHACGGTEVPVCIQAASDEVAAAVAATTRPHARER